MTEPNKEQTAEDKLGGILSDLDGKAAVMYILGNTWGADVEEGILIFDGKVAVRWLTAKRSVSVWDSIDDLLAIHGHPKYGTRIIREEKMTEPNKEQTAEDKLGGMLSDIAQVAVMYILGNTEAANFEEKILIFIGKAGYKSPEEVAELLAKARDGFVPLDEDQSILLPAITDEERKTQFGAGYAVCIQDMLEAGWRKIRQENPECL